MKTRSRIRMEAAMAVCLAATFVLPPAAYQVKERSSDLDHLVHFQRELRVVESYRSADDSWRGTARAERWKAFRARYGSPWKMTLDLRRGVPSLVEGGAVPLIPGQANALTYRDIGFGSTPEPEALEKRVAALSLSFLEENSDLFRIRVAELKPLPGGVAQAGHMWYANFGQWIEGIPVEGAFVGLRINNGNLIHIVTEKYGRVEASLDPAFDADVAVEILAGYIGGFPRPEDVIGDPVSLILIPATPRSIDPDTKEWPAGETLTHLLCYRIAFHREGVVGNWEALIDAHTGEVARFVDRNRYGQVHGGTYPADGHTGETDRPFPYADIGGGQYADAGGLFPGDSATVTLKGKYTHITDGCGSIHYSTTTGDVDFGLGPGMDCSVPDPNNGGPGNTHAARVQYYHLTNINRKVRTYLPGNSWLNNSHMNVIVNQSPWCNATSGGDTLNFYKSDAGCWNLGEIPGVSLHEWGHSLDVYDGSGGMAPPVETYADWSAILQLHDSCVGRGAFLSGNCGGYGDPCMFCSGIRDADFQKHQSGIPWTPQNHGSVWSCGPGSYNGPCGWEDHCESGVSTQALWDLVNRDLPSYSGMDLNSAWLLADRLFYLAVPTVGSNYYCSPPDSNGCNGGSLYSAFRAVDDDGDGTANGTPHAAAIFAAMSRHAIGCGDAGDPQNQNQTSCPNLGAPAVEAIPLDNSVQLNWTPVSGASRYFVFRNETNCDFGFTRIGIVAEPGTTFTDASAVNGITYYYRVQAATGSDVCTGPLSGCVSASPEPCEDRFAFGRSACGCQDILYVEVFDPDLTGGGSVEILAWSTTESTPEAISLAENPPGSGEFTGTLATTPYSAHGDGALGVAHGDTITGSYEDGSYCGVPAIVLTASALVDCQPPGIHDVHVTDVTGTSAVVRWTTTEPADGRVMFGTDLPPSGGSVFSDPLVEEQQVALEGLEELVTYSLYVESADEAGNVAADDNGGSYYSFTTDEPDCSLTCDAEASPASGYVPLDVQFEGVADASYCDGSVYYTWDFGDGAMATGPTPTHTYTEMGSYTWTLTVRAEGVTCVRTGVISAGEVPPCTLECDARASTETGSAPLRVEFTSQVDPSHCQGSPVYYWRFGDGSTSLIQNPSHLYEEPGTYGWTFLAEIDGITCMAQGSVIVEAPPCEVTCQASAEPSAGGAPLTVAFEANEAATGCSSDPVCLWEFGDGESSLGPSVSHVYPEAGTYAWVLTVEADGVTCTGEGSVSVEEPCTLTCASSAAPSSGTAPLQVAFTSNVQEAHCDGPTDIAWLFGDGTGSGEADPLHVYDEPGVYEWVMAAASGDAGCESRGFVTVESACSVACSASVTPGSGRVGVPLAFEAGLTLDGCTGVPAYHWDFGDGSTSGDASPEHAYGEPGEYTWTLAVEVDGMTCTTGGGVTVEAVLPGDADGDGQVSLGEVQFIVNLYLSGEPTSSGADCNGDGRISLGEVQTVINVYLGLADGC